MTSFVARTIALTLGLTLSAAGQDAPHFSPISQNGPENPPESVKPSPLPNPDASGIYHLGGGVIAPKLTNRVEAEFSEQARRRRIDGSCTVQLIVETDGHIRDVHIVKSVADQYSDRLDREAALTLDQKAIDAVSRYQFQPGTFKGKPVPVELKVIIRYTHGFRRTLR